MGARSETVFYQLRSFIKVVDGFDKSVSKTITDHIIHFQVAWKASRHDGEIPSSCSVEQDKKVNGPYQLYQIRVGPGCGYRAWVMFLSNSPDAYWIYVFKKTKDRQPEDMERARVVAQKYWEQIRRGNNA
jgi:hypothetical protein